MFHFQNGRFCSFHVFHAHSPESSSRVHFLDRILITIHLSEMKVVVIQIYKIEKKQVGRFVGAQNIQNVMILDDTKHQINFRKQSNFG